MKIRLDDSLAERAREAAGKAGYSSLEEFVAHLIERELSNLESAQAKEQIVKQLRGLGYLE